MHLISMVAFPLVIAVYTASPTSTRIAHVSMVAFSETAQRGEATTSEIFTHRSLVARSALRIVELVREVAGGASYFREQGLERLFRDIQGARFHPLRPVDQRKLAGRLLVQ